MRNIKVNTLAASLATLAALTSLGAQAQVSTAPGAAAPPDQAGVVYPGRATTAVPAVGVPPQQRGYPGMVTVPDLAAERAPAMPPLPGASVLAGKSPAALAVDDTIPPDVPAQVRELRLRMDEVQRAASANPVAAPRPITRSLAITQAAGEEPPSVRTTMGMPTNLVFTDSTGAPWPIAYATPGDSGQFDILLPVPGTSNVQVRPKTPYAYGGVSITLKGNSIPVSVILTTAQKEMDSRVDMRVMQRGPNAAAPIVDRLNLGGPAPSDAALIGFLDGVPPSGSQEVKTSMRGVRAWTLNDQLYLRTEMTLVSPLWSDSMSSPNGVTHTYLLQNVPSVVVSADGRMVPVAIGE